MFSFVLPCDIEGGAVTDRGADQGKAGQEGDCGSESEEFNDHQPLIVKHGENEVEFPFSGSNENGVGGNGPDDVDAASGTFLDRRGDLPGLLAAEDSAFAGVRIERGDGDPGMAEAEGGQALPGKLDHGDDPLLFDFVDRVTERHVGGQKHEAKVTEKKDHAVPLGPGKLAEDLGVDITTVEGTGPGGRIKERDIKKAAEAAPDTKTTISPVARKMAEDHGLDISSIKGSGPGGRIVKEDVQEAIDKGAAEKAPAEKPAPVAGKG